MIKCSLTKPYYFDVADDSRVCYVEKDFSSKVICKKPHEEVQCLHYDVSKYNKSNSLWELFYIQIDFFTTFYDTCNKKQFSS